jgi:SAM-dependent methyltransferase
MKMSISSEAARITAEYQRREKGLTGDTCVWSQPSNLLFHQQTIRGCISALHHAGRFPLRGQCVADIGCGDGAWLLEFAQWGANPSALSGIDLIEERVDRARRRLPQADLHTGNAYELPWPDDSFHLVSQFTVFSSILDPALQRQVAEEMLRVVKPDGAILWFDLRVDNPRNPHVRGIGAAGVRSLFPKCDIDLTSVVLAPPLARLIAGWSWPLAGILSAIPVLRTHYVGLIRKR